MLKQALMQADTVAISGHIRPDGDCVGSCMALYLYIKEYYKNISVDVYLEDIPESFKEFFETTKEIKHSIDTTKNYDLFIVLDCADVNRLGFAGDLYNQAKQTLCIDHHVSNQAFADNNYIVPEASSTAELIYRLMDKSKINTEIAEYLYMGIAHDTGIFQYSCTEPATMEAAADLMRKNIRAPQLIDKTYYEKTYAQNKVLGKALLDSYCCLDDKCIVSVITNETMNEFGVIPKDMEGIVSQLRVTKDVEVAIFLYELAPQEYKISLRSKNDIDVSIIAGCFGGGGHRKAAGANAKGDAKTIVSAFLEQVELQL